LKRYKLIDRRKKLNLSQKEVAKRSKISRSYYGLIENGSRNPSYKIANNIARAVNENIEQLFTDEIFFANKCYKTKHKFQII
jgi:putative transcriptional regulator